MITVNGWCAGQNIPSPLGGWTELIPHADSVFTVFQADNYGTSSDDENKCVFN